MKFNTGAALIEFDNSNKDWGLWLKKVKDIKKSFMNIEVSNKQKEQLVVAVSTHQIVEEM